MESLPLTPGSLLDKEWAFLSFWKWVFSGGIATLCLHHWLVSSLFSACVCESSFPSVQVRNGSFRSKLPAEFTLGWGQTSWVPLSCTRLPSVQCSGMHLPSARIRGQDILPRSTHLDPLRVLNLATPDGALKEEQLRDVAGSWRLRHWVVSGKLTNTWHGLFWFHCGIFLNEFNSSVGNLLLHKQWLPWQNWWGIEKPGSQHMKKYRKHFKRKFLELLDRLLYVTSLSKWYCWTAQLPSESWHVLV